MESFGIPENSEDDLRGQISSPWCVLYIKGKVLKCRCPKLPRIGHLDIYSSSYGQKKGRKSTTKSRESTSSQRCFKECNKALESSWQELQFWFGARLDPSSWRGAMTVQSPETPTRDNFGTPTWESWEKEPFGCSLGGELQSILYGGRWWLPPSPGRGKSCV